MKQDTILVRVLGILENNQDEIRKMQLANSPNEFAALFESLHVEINEIVIANIANVICNFLFIENLNIEDLINFLREKLNNPFDILTLEREVADGFDDKFGTKTGLIREQYMLCEPISLSRFKNAARYHPTPVGAMNLALDYLRKANVQFDKSIFIDVGSGMGRNLLIASECPFSKIVGIELSRELHEIAEKNIRIYKSESQVCKNIESCCMDILDYELPNSECLILYFWGPFLSETYNKLHLKIIESIVQNKQKIMLVFLGDVFPVVEKSQHFRRMGMLETNDKTSPKDYFYLSFFTS